MLKVKLRREIDGTRRMLTSHNGNFMIFKQIWTEVPDEFLSELNPAIYKIEGQATEVPKPIEKKVEPVVEEKPVLEKKSILKPKKDGFKLKTK